MLTAEQSCSRLVFPGQAAAVDSLTAQCDPVNDSTDG